MQPFLPTQLFTTDSDGIVQPASYALSYFTLTGTTTPSPVYTDDTLTTAHPDPLVANDEGAFPAVYLNPALQYRVRIIYSTGDLSDPTYDEDPINEPASALTSADISTALGYVPLNPADAVLTAEGRLNYTLPLVVLHQDSMGFRGRPVSIKDVGYTFALDDAGKLLLKDDTSTPAWVVPKNATIAFPTGTVIHVMNVNTGAVSIVRDSGVELRIAGSATNSDKSLAQWGSATLTKYDTDKWLVSGTGVT